MLAREVRPWEGNFFQPIMPRIVSCTHTHIHMNVFCFFPPQTALCTQKRKLFFSSEIVSCSYSYTNICQRWCHVRTKMNVPTSEWFLIFQNTENRSDTMNNQGLSGTHGLWEHQENNNSSTHHQNKTVLFSYIFTQQFARSYLQEDTFPNMQVFFFLV